jgi:hypothetical protein
MTLRSGARFCYRREYMRRCQVVLLLLTGACSVEQSTGAESTVPRSLTSVPGPALPEDPTAPRPTTILIETTCNSAGLDACLRDADHRLAVCESTCTLQPIWACPCAARHWEDLEACRRTLACPSSTQCVWDAQKPLEYCCPSAKPHSCGGRCIECPPSKVPNPVTCACECAPTLSKCFPPSRRDPTDCECKCPRACAVAGMEQNPVSCQCSCPMGTIQCGNRCVDLQTDRDSCGACGAKCGASEQCCDGKCIPLASDEHCGSCNVSCTASKSACCFAGGIHACFDTNNNPHYCGPSCQDCQFATTNRLCYSGQCKCRAGFEDCDGSGCFCETAKGRACCPGPDGAKQCVDLKNSRRDCGTCGNAVPEGSLCCEGMILSGLSKANCGACGRQCAGVETCEACGGASKCMDLISLPSAPAWVQWRNANPNAPKVVCVDGVMKCHPTLSTVGDYCCPPGYTQVVKNNCEP